MMNKKDDDLKGRVYWITGLSGSGKTTLGTALYYDLRRKRSNVLLLDGDLLKSLVNDSIGYSPNDRLRRGKQYSKICKLLAEQGMWVIICTIAMFDEIREWNREHIKGYIEIFLDTPFEVLKIRDKKGLYSRKQVDLNSDIEFPKNPDIVLVNDENTSVKSLVKSVEALTPKKEDDFSRDKDYWNQYYSDCSMPVPEPSDFAKKVFSYIKSLTPRTSPHILELGCGNGRDSLFFIKNGMYVTGIDASNVCIDKLNRQTLDYPHAFFICDDFTKCRAVFQRQYDIVYSRFTLHAITYEQETELFNNLRDALKDNGRIFIEARSILDDLYGLGEKIATHTFIYNNHFRRFIDKNDLIEKLEKLGFEILRLKEGRGFSKTNESDPVLLRLEVALKNN